MKLLLSPLSRQNFRRLKLTFKLKIMSLQEKFVRYFAFNTILDLAILRIVLTNVGAVEKFPIEQLHSNHSKNELEKKR